MKGSVFRYEVLTEEGDEFVVSFGNVLEKSFNEF